MLLLASGGEQYGLQLIANSGGKLRRGLIYITLELMEDRGLIESRPEDVGDGERPTSSLRRRLYRLTEAGRKAAAVIQGSRRPSLPVRAPLMTVAVPIAGSAAGKHE